MGLRYPDWPERMHSAIRAKKGAPFERGVNDCCLFACDIALAMTGVDPGEPFRGKYSTKRGAFAQLRGFTRGRELPEGSLILGAADRISEDLGWPRVNREHAGRGDFCAFKVPNPGDLGFDYTLGIVVDDRAVFLGEDGGTIFVPLEKVEWFWGVPSGN